MRATGNQRLGLGFLILVSVLLVVPQSFAQAPPLLPVQGFPRVPQGSPIPRILPSPPPAVTPGLPVSPAPQPGETPAINVAVHSVVITGETVYPESELDHLVVGLRGQSVPLSKIEAARLAIL